MEGVELLRYGIVLALAILISCMPETDPYRLAPTSRSVPYLPCCEPNANPDHPSRFPFPSIGQPVRLPKCDGECLTLADLIDIALFNSTETQTTWAAAREAAAEYGQSRSYYYPTVDAVGVLSRLRAGNLFGTPAVITQEISINYAQLQLNWLLVDMGTRRSRALAFKEALLNANWTHNREIQTVVQQIMTDYFNYEAAIGLVVSSEADVADAEVNLDATLVKHRAGIADISDVAMARTILAQKELSLLGNVQQREQTLGQLTADMGIPSSEPLCVAPLSESLPIPKLCESVDYLLARAYNVRPDLFAAWANLRSKKASIDQAIGTMLPTLTFNGSFGRTYFNGGQTDDYDYFAQVTLQIPLFQGWLQWNQVKAARAELEAAKAQLRALEIAISQQVVVSYKTFKIAGEKVVAGHDYVEAARESYSATLARYKIGTVDFVTLANAFAELADARAALVLAHQDLWNSLTQLAYATGALESPLTDVNTRTRICP